MTNAIVMYQPNISKDFGLIKAIILQQIHFGAEVTGIFVGERKWKATNIRKLCAETGLGSMTSMRRWVKSLLDDEVLTKSQKNCFNELYRLNYQKVAGGVQSSTKFILEGQDYIPIKVSMIKTLGLVKAAVLAAIDTDLKYHGNKIEGLTYVFKTARSLSTKSYIGAVRSMRRQLLELISLGYLKQKCGLNKMSSDRTKWYAKVELYRVLNPQKIKFRKVEVRPIWTQRCVHFGRLGASTLDASNIKYIQESILQESLSSPIGSYRQKSTKNLVVKTIGEKCIVESNMRGVFTTKNKLQNTNSNSTPIVVVKDSHLTKGISVVNCPSNQLGGTALTATCLLKTSGKKSKKTPISTVSALLAEGLKPVKHTPVHIKAGSTPSFFKYFDRVITESLGAAPNHNRTAKDFGMAKHLLKSFSENTTALEFVLSNWLGFIDFLYANKLVNEAPRVPVLAFLLTKVAYVHPFHEKRLESLHTYASTPVLNQKLPAQTASTVKKVPPTPVEVLPSRTSEGWIIVDRPKDLPQESVHLYLNYIMAKSDEDKALWLTKLHEVGFHVYG